jgi:RNA polymerase sigma factor for flagellar operon FliA
MTVAVKTKDIAGRPRRTASLPPPAGIEDSTAHLKSVAVRAYTGQKAQSFDKKQIVQFLPMVHKIAQRVVTYLKPPLSFKDLVSAGTIGLLKAARDFDPSRRAGFKTYAYIRIKGAILDEMRGLSLLPANLNKQVQRAVELARKITEQSGSVPTDADLAEELGITVNELYKIFENARAQHFISLDGFGDDSAALGVSLAAKTTTPAQQIEKDELIDRLTKAIQQLPERQRRIILLYYHQHLTMKQIAAVFKITEPRVSQLHASALFNLSIKLRQWKDGG